MATGVNKVILVGRLGKDPEVRYSKNGGAVATLSLATAESWKDKDGTKQERTEWHRVVAWGKLGELCGEHLGKGSQAYVEGRLQTREWQDKAGDKRYTTEVIAQSVQFLSPKDHNTERFAGPAVVTDFPDSPVRTMPMTDEDVPF